MRAHIGIHVNMSVQCNILTAVFVQDTVVTFPGAQSIIEVEGRTRRGYSHHYLTQSGTADPVQAY
jgi:hypothetical protein